MSTRCTIAKKGNPSAKKVVAISAAMNFSEFLDLCSEKLDMKADKAFIDDGEVDDVSLIRDGDTVLVAEANGGSLETYAIAVMGPGSVGKSAMTLQYVQGVFVMDYDPTIEDAYRKNTSVDGKPCLLDILDTAGQEDYTALRSTWMRNRDAFVLVFSLTERSTFEDVDSFYNQLKVMHEDKLPPLIVVGNKADLVDEREVNTAEGQKLAEGFGALYLETSAKTGQNIDTTFEKLVDMIRDRATSKGGGTKTPEKKKRFCCIV